MAGCILVVDDNQLNLELLREVLEQSGYHVEQAATASEAFASVRQRRPSLVLLDIGLPDLDGYQVARALKADPATRNIPLVAVTAFAMTGDADRAREAGFDAHITKPVDTRAVPGLVAQFLAAASVP